MAGNINLGTLVVKLMGDSRHLESVLGRSQSKVAEFARGISHVGRNLSYMLTMPLAGAAAYALKMAGAFDSPVFTATRERFEGIAASIGVQLLPAFNAIMNIVQKGLNWWSGLNESTKKNYLMWGLIAAAAGPVVSILSGIIGLVVPLIAGFASLAVAALPWILTLGLVAAAAALINDAFLETFTGINTGLLDAVNQTRIAGHSIATWFTRAWVEALAGFEIMRNEITGWFKSLPELVKVAFPAMGLLGEMGTGRTSGTIMGERTKTLEGLFSQEKEGGGLGDWAKKHLGGLGDTFSGVVDSIMGKWDEIKKSIFGDSGPEQAFHKLAKSTHDVVHAQNAQVTNLKRMSLSGMALGVGGHHGTGAATTKSTESPGGSTESPGGSTESPSRGGSITGNSYMDSLLASMGFGGGLSNDQSNLYGEGAAQAELARVGSRGRGHENYLLQKQKIEQIENRDVGGGMMEMGRGVTVDRDVGGGMMEKGGANVPLLVEGSLKTNDILLQIKEILKYPSPATLSR